MNTCRTCHYWEGGNREKAFGVCHRHPPLSDGFPFVREDDWCGEFSPMPPECGYPTEHPSNSHYEEWLRAVYPENYPPPLARS